MGLGKTAASLRALTPEMLPVLVNAPKRVAEEVWPVEVPKWRPDLTVKVAAGTPKQREAALLSDADIVVIGRDNLADAVPHAGRFKTHIIDELSGYKNRASQRWKAARKINKDMPQVWGLTGTPSPNGLLDVWAQLYLIDNGEALGTGVTGYRERYFRAKSQMSNGIVTEWELRPGAEQRIHQLMERSCLSMSTEGRIELPPTTYNDVSVPLTPSVRRLYKQMKDNLCTDAEMLGGVVYSAMNAAVLSNKLSQITAGFLYPDDREFSDEPAARLHKEKGNALREIVDGTGSPVLIAYRFQEELDILKESLGSLAHTIDEPNVVKRWNAGEIPALLAHPASAGHGLNLQFGGHTMVWATLPWSLEEYQQMNKRLARQGQKHPVVIHHLMSPKTVDPKIKMVLDGKATVQQALMDHLESPI
jgi:SNF2 family DNA or RNA helicase